MINEQEFWDTTGLESKMPVELKLNHQVYNAARQEMLLAFMKMMPSVEEIERIIKEEHIMTQGVCDNDVFVVVAYKRLAEAIHSLIMGRMR